ncbi:MAG: carbamoyltransferase HypF [Opitutae bacterium]|nr:carbamoyltransferase HypF [Opitutae bacterium]
MPLTPENDCLFTVTGTVQGVGFRPFVARLAAQLGVRGWVRNDTTGVTLRASASVATLAEFERRLRADAPAVARIATLAVRAATTADLPPLPATGFLILESASLAVVPTAAVTPDLALCADCRRELATPTDRRHGYPFINCTHCGPRYSILRELPYDRPRTTMAVFAMCPVCQREYDDPANRRYHAQPNACPDCGPHVELCDAHGVIRATHTDAVAASASALRAGQIVAVKGIGGFHLFVDATNDVAVRELRCRKHREEKPLAVMFPSFAAIAAVAELSDEQRQLLASPAAPIVLVRRHDKTPLATSLAPGNPWLGVFLPYAPLHVLLLGAFGDPVVATSGNLSDEPLCTDNAEARQRLGAIADLFLQHNREIARPVDDSVVRTSAIGPILLRRARGYAPTPLTLPPSAQLDEPLLCVGAHMKNAVAVTVGDQLVLSPHIGDLGNAPAAAAFARTVELLSQLYGGKIARVACDVHPDYASTQYAEKLGVPVVRVQHHLAHILACLLEHGGGPERVLGVAWDGTGYGSDGTIWGGEFILVDRVARTAQRVAHLRPFRLPGGEAAVREPRRIALGLLHAAGMDVDTAALGFSGAQASLLRDALARGVNAPVTTSAGRLFDGVAALLGLRTHTHFEGQAAMDVEFCADAANGATAPLRLDVRSDPQSGKLLLDWVPALAEICATRHKLPAPELAAGFHQALANAIGEVAARCGVETVALTGGCFQNARLLELATRQLRARAHTVLLHRELPPNDGSIAAGQALAVAWGIAEVSP